ncbi:MAG TPA: addiction module protein [Verrucomicrobiae bacterium]|jgi:putative addiction module component (TIGR02574 family)
MIDVAALEGMSLVEKLQVMEILWRSISNRPNDVPSPEWHKAIIDSRMADINSGEARFLTLEELKQRLNRKSP